MKEIKDYTLGEARDICRETRNCSACVFCREDGSCKILGTPNSWDVKNKSWTQKDEEDAKAAMRIFDNGHNTVDWIFAERRDVNGRIHINVARTDGSDVRDVILIGSEAFPSLTPEMGWIDIGKIKSGDTIRKAVENVF